MDHYLDVKLYPYPNPALSEILVGEGMRAVLTDYTEKVRSNYVARLANRPRRGDKHPGLMAENTHASVHVGGYKGDRLIGEITVATEYAATDEFGRHSNNPYGGSGDLRGALYSVLPPA